MPALKIRRIDFADPKAAKQLADRGYHVEQAESGEAAIARLADFAFDIIITDLRLPGVDGYEVCRRIRQQAWGKDMVVVALTGWGHDEARTKTRQAGFDMHLVKPVSPEQLDQAIAGPARPP